MKLDNLSIDEKIGQRFIFGVNDDNIDGIIDLIKNAYIGGVILYKKNYCNYQDMISVVKRLKKANKNNKIPLFISIDQEGGKVNRIPGEIHPLKNIYDVSKRDPDLVSDYARVINLILKETGINMNFSPVVDIYNNSKSKVLYKRCFYGDPQDVSNCCNKYVKEANDNGIVSVIKHYPGHGVSRNDSHFIIPYVFNYGKVINKHMIPFDMAIDKGIDAIMVGHLIIRKLTKLMPASIASDFINKYLREKNNYKGLIITDEVNMLKRNLLYRFNYLTKALKSPNDMILIKIRNTHEAYKIIAKYKEVLIKDSKYNDMLDSSVARITKIKEKYAIDDNINYKGIDIDKINIEIDAINERIN